MKHHAREILMAACQCMDCECLLQHNKVVRELRCKTRLQLQQHGEWMVHVNGNTGEAESELNTALRRVTNVHEPLSTCRMGNSARVESNGNGIAKKCVCHGKHTQH